MSLDTRHHDLTEILQIQHLPQMPLHLQTALRAQFATPLISSTEPPQLIVIGGGPGVGKSFFYESLKNRAALPQGHVLHDPDCLMQAIPEYQSDFRADPYTAFQRWELPVRQLSHELLREALLHGQTVVYMRTLAYADSLELLAYCKKMLGYQIIIHLLTCPVDLAIQRAHARQETIQRHLSPEVISQRHHMVTAHIPQLQEIADQYVQYDEQATLNI